MIVENINKFDNKPRILVAPLDWGLGHATRCIPIINVLIEHNAEVIVAADGLVAKLLQEEFPSIVILPLKGYKVNYSRNKRSFFLKMLMQFPKLFASINHEKKWLAKIIASHQIDAVISDNRFGLYHEKKVCVYVTHQLSIQTGNHLLDKIAQKINYHFINKFSECWVPDTEGSNDLAGKLSHPGKLPARPVKYLGILSRCKKIVTEKKYELLILLSGPEPQRTIFEEILLSQSKDMEGAIVLVRGLPGSEKKISIQNDNMTVYDHLPAGSLNKLIQSSVNVIARCGYSTIMDMATLQQKAILVPTPGQTEQEYLATYVKERKLFFTCSQENFSLHQALEQSRRFDFANTEIQKMRTGVIVDWIGELKTRLRVLQ